VGKVSPSVTVEVDFRAIHNESETYTPVVDEQGIEQRTEEHRESSSGGAAQPGGVPGTTSNIPGYLGISGGESQQSEQSKYDLIVDYLVNKKVSLEDLPPGTITRRSAAVALSTDTWDETAKASVEQLVATAIGADVSKGDSINVQAFQFAGGDGAAATQDYLRQQSARNMARIAGWVVALLMVGLLMLLLRGVIGSALPRDDMALAAAGVPRGGEGFEIREQSEAGYSLKRLDEMGATQQDQMRQEIGRMIDKNPGQVVSLVRSWLLEDS
jgi:flagellar M-ring protein FliF